MNMIINNQNVTTSNVVLIVNNEDIEINGYIRSISYTNNNTPEFTLQFYQNGEEYFYRLLNSDKERIRFTSFSVEVTFTEYQSQAHKTLLIENALQNNKHNFKCTRIIER